MIFLSERFSEKTNYLLQNVEKGTYDFIDCWLQNRPSEQINNKKC